MLLLITRPPSFFSRRRNVTITVRFTAKGDLFKCSKCLRHLATPKQSPSNKPAKHVIKLILSQATVALPPPEGIVWFDRSVLKNDVANLDDEEQFEKFALLEVVTNRSYDEAYKGKDDPLLPHEPHPRAGKQSVSYDATKYVRWQRLNCMVGPDAKSMRRQIIWDATGDAFEFERRTKKFKVCFLPVPMPTKDERFLWVDLTFPVRALYLPLSRIADQRVPRFAAYIHLNLRIYDVSLKTYKPHDVPIEKASSTVGKTLGGALGPTSQIIGQTLGQKVGGVAQNVVDGQYVPGTEKPVPEPNLTEAERDKIQQKEGAPRTYWAGNLIIKADQTHGWSWRPEWTMRIDARALIEMLIIPMHLRLPIYISPYRYVKLFHATAIDNTGVATIAQKVMDAWVAIDYAGLVSRHGGIPLDYKATGIPESSITQILLAILTPKASMLPVAGTVLSLGLGYLAEYLDDPQAMLTKHSPAKKGTEIGLLFIQGANRVRKYYASGKIPTIQLPRRGPGMRQALEGQDRQSIFVGEEGEKAQAQEMTRDEKTIGVTIDEIEDPQREVDKEDDEEMQAVTWLGYSPLVIEKQ